MSIQEYYEMALAATNAASAAAAKLEEEEEEAAAKKRGEAALLKAQNKGKGRTGEQVKEGERDVTGLWREGTDEGGVPLPGAEQRRMAQPRATVAKAATEAARRAGTLHTAELYSEHDSNGDVVETKGENGGAGATKKQTKKQAKKEMNKQMMKAAAATALVTTSKEEEEEEEGKGRKRRDTSACVDEYMDNTGEKGKDMYEILGFPSVEEMRWGQWFTALTLGPMAASLVILVFLLFIRPFYVFMDIDVMRYHQHSSI